MASLKDLRARIKSVKNTRQITKTMKMVSAAKVNRARAACEKSRPFAERLNRVLSNLAAATQGGPVLLSGRDKVHTIRLIVVGSDRGLCGGFNNNLLRRARAQIESYKRDGFTVQLVVVGRKVRDSLRGTHRDLIVAEHAEIFGQGYSFADELALSTIAAFEAGACDKVTVLYNRFVNMLKQEPTLQQLVPFASIEAEEGSTSAASSFEYEPSEEQILRELLPQNVAVQFYSAMLESQASEQAARMTAMDNASRNAGDVIKRLTLKYNRGRQAAVTSELIEIISGAEAV